MKRSQAFYSLLMCALLVGIAATLIMGDTPWNLVWDGALRNLNGTSQEWNPLLDERRDNAERSLFMGPKGNPY